MLEPFDCGFCFLIIAFIRFDRSNSFYFLLVRFLPLPLTPLKNACAHRLAHGESGAPIEHVTMNRGGEAGAATMVFGMAGMVPGCVVLFFLDVNSIYLSYYSFGVWPYE